MQNADNGSKIRRKIFFDQRENLFIMFLFFPLSGNYNHKFFLVIDRSADTGQGCPDYSPTLIKQSQKNYVLITMTDRWQRGQLLFPILIANLTKTEPRDQEIKGKIKNLQDPINIKKNNKIDHPQRPDER